MKRHEKIILRLVLRLRLNFKTLKFAGMAHTHIDTDTHTHTL